VREVETRAHREECMFEQLVEVKGSHGRLMEENLKLKLRITELEDALDDSVRSKVEARQIGTK
jgi:regulator of replication initiation timing